MTIDARDFVHAADALERHGFERQAGVTVAWALKRGGNVVRRNVRAKARTHRRTGRLNRNVRVDLKGAGLGLEVKVRASGMVAPIIAGGAKPHEIAPIRSRALALHGAGRRGGVVGFAAVVQHPGVRPDPFFRAGVDESQAEIQQIVNDSASTMARELAWRMKGRK